MYPLDQSKLSTSSLILLYISIFCPHITFIFVFPPNQNSSYAIETVFDQMVGRGKQTADNEKEERRKKN